MKEKFCVNDYILYVILIEPNLYCNPSSIYWYREREREKREEKERGEKERNYNLLVDEIHCIPQDEIAIVQ